MNEMFFIRTTIVLSSKLPITIQQSSLTANKHFLFLISLYCIKCMSMSEQIINRKLKIG